MSNSNAGVSAEAWAATPYHPRHSEWPYAEADFARHDPDDDSSFYSAPRFVTHIDDAAISSLKRYYESALPKKGRILDFCSSWISHMPDSIDQAAKQRDLNIVLMGMSQEELERNNLPTVKILVQDLNKDATIPLTVCGEQATSGMSSGVLSGENVDDGESGLLDASTCVVSIDYLIHPLNVLSSLLERTRTGGTVHLVVSNRCFPTKAISRWLRISEEERLDMVGDYLHFAGWGQIKIIDLKAGDEQGKLDADKPQGNLQQFMKMMGMGTDPLWCVRATKLGKTAA